MPSGSQATSEMFRQAVIAEHSLLAGYRIDQNDVDLEGLDSIHEGRD